MSNLIYTDRIYNDYQKERYLNQRDIEESTKEGYRIVFKRSSMLENHLGKDLFNFNSPEVERFMKLLDPGVATTAANYVSMIKNYIDWAISESLRTFNRINPITDFNLNKSFYNNFAATPRDAKLFNYDTIWREIIQECKNAQDAVIICLLFEGVNTEEILNLTRNDILENTDALILKNDIGESRNLIVDDKTISLCYRALEPYPYEKLNGNSRAKAKTLKVVESDHVVRSVKSNTRDAAKADYHAIYRRLKMLSKQLNFPYLQSINIRNSGMLKTFRDLNIVKNGNVEDDDYFEICERYGLERSRNNYGSMVYNHYLYKSEFLNAETMKSVYGE
jgi:hypothetical protein